MHHIPKLMRFAAGECFDKLSAMSRISVSVTSKKSFRLLNPPSAMMELQCWTSVKPIHCRHWLTSANAAAAAILFCYVVLQVKGATYCCVLLFIDELTGCQDDQSRRSESRRLPISEVLHQVVRGCSSRRMMCHHHSPSFAACEPKRIGSDKPNESCLSTEDASAIIGCSSGLSRWQKSEGK